MKKYLPLLLTLVCAASIHAQDLDFQTLFEFEPARITSPPSIGEVGVVFPDEARKNGIDGTAKAKMILGSDGRVRDIVVTEDLPFGVGNALRVALEKMRFTPAGFNGKPVDLGATVTYRVRAVYSEYDKDVSKVKLAGRPVAEYPSALRAQGRSGKVMVGALFQTDGKIEVLKVESTMPTEFDEAAKKAAVSLKFEPAVHKKSRRPVNMTMWVTFEFKP